MELYELLAHNSDAYNEALVFENSLERAVAQDMVA
jgi:hypothetical protein